ncbi:MAG: NUDIX hydrolase [Pseudomonadota bacterium]
MSNNAASASKIIPSATVLLLRDGAEGLEVFMVVRHHQIDFASGALVFPGGKADPQDFDDALIPFLNGAPDDAAQRAIVVSGIRELFEESGVLLARDQGSDALVSGERIAGLAQDRERLNDGSLPLLEWLQREQLILACDQLVHFAHWITPEMMPKRFDTHFYLVTAPGDQLAVHDGYESVDSVWIRPQDALAGAGDGRYTIIFPTLRNLEKLARHDSVPAALQASRNDSIVTVLPWTERRDDGNYLCIPTNAGYTLCEEKMPERSRG